MIQEMGGGIIHTSVINQPGAIPLTRTPRGSSSRASWLVNIPIAAFENKYGNEFAAVVGSYRSGNSEAVN